MASNVLLTNIPRTSYKKEDGHTLLLMETRGGNKTFQDFNNVTLAIESLVKIFEEHKTMAGEFDLDGYDVTVLWDWMDQHFTNLDIMIFDQNIVRYRRHGIQAFKEIMIAKLEVMSN